MSNDILDQSADTHDMHLSTLHSLVGPDHVHGAASVDSVNGMAARWVASPGSVEAAAAILRYAAQEKLAVVPRGSGTKMGWATRPRQLDMIIDTHRLQTVLEHAAGDLVVRVQAGVTLAQLQETLATQGQRLALDPWPPQATIGGIIAANASGPLRYRYGTVRDLLIGITTVLSDGTVAHSGGKVVKNVAGYDLGKLFAGSFGTLGLIVEAIFRLHPLPPTHQWLTVDLPQDQLGQAIQAILHATLTPSALELWWPSARDVLMLAILFEGIAPAVLTQTEQAHQLLAPFGRTTPIEPESDAEHDMFTEVITPPWRDRTLGLRMAVPPAALPTLVQVIRSIDLSANLEGGAELGGHAGSGILFIGLSPAPDRAVELVERLRRHAAELGGSMTIPYRAVALPDTLDVWGNGGDALPLMFRLKERFDPAGIMSPGRFIGGI